MYPFPMRKLLIAQEGIIQKIKQETMGCICKFCILLHSNSTLDTTEKARGSEHRYIQSQIHTQILINPNRMAITKMHWKYKNTSSIFTTNIYHQSYVQRAKGAKIQRIPATITFKSIISIVILGIRFNSRM